MKKRNKLLLEEPAIPAIAIQLPAVEADQQIDVEVKSNGRTRRLCYRVEILAWEQCEELPAQRASCLQRLIAQYDKNWQLI